MIGLATDETSAMNEIKSGFGTLLQERFPSVRTIHRLVHRLQLAVKDVLKYVAGISHFKVLVGKLNYIVFAVSQKKKKKKRKVHTVKYKKHMNLFCHQILMAQVDNLQKHKIQKII